MERCVNIDWLEVYALEPLSVPRNADYFRLRGWEVNEREYGTPMYNEMFTLVDHRGFDYIEIRRSPKSKKDFGGLFDINGCHIRLSNRTCYYEGAAELLHNFLLEHSFTFSRISRIDLCIDIRIFDSRDLPKQFVRRFMEGKYSKINQCELTAHGTDEWAGRVWNSLSWGKRKSDIRTRFYCKSLELQQVKDKPYIRQAWFASHLVDNPVTMLRTNPDGTSYRPDIWRLEFQISSAVKRWFTIRPDENNGQYQSIRNTLDCYFTRRQLIAYIDSLQRHYFHFKYYESGRRKDRCRDKVLFNFTENDTIYKIDRDNVAGTASPSYADQVLLTRIQRYQEEHHMNKDLYAATQVIIDALNEQKLRFSTAQPFSRTHMQALQLAIAERLVGRVTNPVALERQINALIDHTLNQIF